MTGIQGQALSREADPGGTAYPSLSLQNPSWTSDTNSRSLEFLLEDASHTLDNDGPGDRALVPEDPQGSQAHSHPAEIKKRHCQIGYSYLEIFC